MRTAVIVALAVALVSCDEAEPAPYCGPGPAVEPSAEARGAMRPVCPVGTRCVDGARCEVEPDAEVPMQPPRDVLGTGGAPTRMPSSPSAGPSSGPTGATQCSGGLVPCDGRCVDPATDPQSCGGCGVTCGPGGACVLGRCCASGLTVCSGLCVDVQTDPYHCGTCDSACSNALVCLQGTCQPPGTTLSPSQDPGAAGFPERPGPPPASRVR